MEVSAAKRPLAELDLTPEGGRWATLPPPPPLRAARLGLGGNAGDNLGCNADGLVSVLSDCGRLLVNDWHFFNVSSYVGCCLLMLFPEFFRISIDLSMLGLRATDGFRTGAGRSGWAGKSGFPLGTLLLNAAT